MEIKDFIIVAVIVFILSAVFSFIGASPFTIENEVIKPIDPDAQVNLGLHFAEGYYQSYTTPLVIPIMVANLYYNITNFTINNLNGITIVNNKAMIMRAANYKIDGTMSFRGGNSGEYEVELFVNNIAQPHCSFFRSTSSVALGDASFSCIEYLNSGDTLSIKVKDINPPAQSISISAFNFNIFEIP